MAKTVVEDHIRKARDLMDLAESQFLLGNDLEGSSKVWESVSHIVTAVAEDREWEHDGSPDSLRKVAKRLANECDDPSISTGFLAVEIFRDNAELGFMEDFQITHNSVTARRYVRRVAERVTDKIVFI